MLPYFPMVVRTLAVGPGFSFASCLPFALLRAFGILVQLASLLQSSSLPLRWGHPCGVEDCLSSIGTKVWSPLRSGTLVRSWLDLPPLSAGICAPGPQGVLPGGAPLTVGLLPGSPTLLCPLSSGCPVGWEASPSGEASASSCRFSWRPGAVGALAVILPEAASQRGFLPLCLILPLPGSVSFSHI